MKDTVKYEFHHFGIPLQDGKEEGVFSKKAGMYTVDNPGKFRVQWHRFTDNSPLHLLLGMDFIAYYRHPYHWR